MLQELTNKIKKIIPDIEELKFGCEVEFENFKQTLSGKVCFGDEIVTILRPDGDNIYERDREDITKIIGRPITLEDILRCLIEKNIGFNIQKCGQNVISLFNNIDCYWELGKPLHKQSKYVIEELNNLI